MNRPNAALQVGILVLGSLLIGVIGWIIWLRGWGGVEDPDPKLVAGTGEFWGKDYHGSDLKPEYHSQGSDEAPSHSRALYLDLMKRSLTDLIYDYNTGDYGSIRGEGRDWPERAMTMIGLQRLDNLHFCMEDVLAREVPGDFIEAGAWRGGATIFMRAVLKSHSVNDRVVWVADSFEGLPPPNTEKYPADTGATWHQNKTLAVTLESVKSNFERYELLDDQVKFLKGFFEDTLPNAPIERLAVLRLDGDLYGSTMDTLVSLYPKLSSGGYCIVDDYGSIGTCRKAVDDYRSKHGITEEIKKIDWAGSYWLKK